MKESAKIYAVVDEKRSKVYSLHKSYDSAHGATGWGMTDGVVLEFNLSDGVVSEGDDGGDYY